MTITSQDQKVRGKNSYTFDEFLEKRSSLDWYKNDPILQKALKKYAGAKYEQIHNELQHFSSAVSSRWNPLAERAARPEARPSMLHFDAFNHRIDRVVRPMETHQLEKEVFGAGLFSSKMPAWESFAKRMLIHQLGEAGVACPLTCTIGLIALLEQYPNEDIPELEQILQHTKEGLEGDFAIGAQFMTEIQGGSDLPANVLEAVPDGKYYRLFGNKFFCSVAHADYSVVTAKISGTDKVSTFIVPSWLSGDKDKEKRNGYEINRIKWKMGTAELPTGEFQYNGALAYPVGPAGKGVAIAAGIVLTLSRLEIGIACAGFMLRAAREASLYGNFRTVFGKKVKDYPLSVRTLKKIEDAAHRTTAGAFKIYHQFLFLDQPLNAGIPVDQPIELRKQLFNLRELVLLQKICATNEGAEVLRDAISVFAGHGVMEEFSSLPRIFRDIVVNEQWEGPRNLLLTQIYRDIQRVTDWYPSADFVANVLEGASQETIDRFAEQLTDLLQRPVCGEVSEASMEAAEEWDVFCDSFFKAYQKIALEELQ
ncbi:alkylation response protein AidB-like acyl-CoA dehydrogenase [Cytobacillus firmus]|uniref:Alkylation response protein AidB-like acyl-CoA dehydrogenase n=2 Tax=Cytobacillus TaxID=2675230 RepID=A0A366JUU0_CYTFI|nr:MULTISPECIES: acyl-CoA dehydrogenase family protein [Cytobacillus]RBP92983.1 alkylation response protein AidB-like acyl-CoA dehydrogenase [Cytobacillus firmus]TDX42585.1 alkylation response protein AidB-like acyl-CoA dehydrogenase [Cytobacillus oceanisediminis]